MVDARRIASDPASATSVANAALALLARAADPVVVHDDALVVTAWNDAAARCFGVAADAAVGASLVDLLLTDADAARWRAALAGPGPAAELACRRRGLGPIACAWQAEPVDAPARAWLCMVRPLPAPSLDERVLGAVLDNLPISVWVVDRAGDYVFHDGLGVAQLGIERRSWVGLNLWELWGAHEGTAETLRQVRVAMASSQSTHAFAEAMGMTWETWCVPLPGADGQPEFVVSVTIDITAGRRAEAELRGRLAVIESQQELIRTLATPLIDIWDGVLTAPLVGNLDGDRATALMGRLLDEVTRKRVRYTILDLTGVEVIEATTAAHLIGLVKAIRLLGAEAILTGIRPAVAQSLVDVGTDLTGIRTHATLRSGLEHCMQRIAARRS